MFEVRTEKTLTVEKVRAAIAGACAALALIATCAVATADDSQVNLPACQTVGGQVAADLSTTQQSLATDPHWWVTDPTSATFQPGHTTLSAWTALPNNWVQPSAPTASATNPEPVGDYTYTLTFFIPCNNKNYKKLQIEGDASADNSILSISANGHASVASCVTGTCFNTLTHFVIPQADLVGGLNTLTIVVHNDDLYSGLAVSAALSAMCGKKCCLTLAIGKGKSGDCPDCNSP